MGTLKKSCSLAEHPHVGLIWDLANMWTVTKEPPAEAIKIKKIHPPYTYQRCKMVDGKIQYTLLGQGEVPIFEAIDVLVKRWIQRIL